MSTVVTVSPGHSRFLAGFWSFRLVNGLGRFRHIGTLIGTLNPRNSMLSGVLVPEIGSSRDGQLVPVEVVLVDHPCGRMPGDVNELVAGCAHLPETGQRGVTQIV